MRGFQVVENALSDRGGGEVEAFLRHMDRGSNYSRDSPFYPSVSSVLQFRVGAFIVHRPVGEVRRIGKSKSFLFFASYFLTPLPLLLLVFCLCVCVYILLQVRLTCR